MVEQHGARAGAERLELRLRPSPRRYRWPSRSGGSRKVFLQAQSVLRGPSRVTSHRTTVYPRGAKAEPSCRCPRATIFSPPSGSGRWSSTASEQQLPEAALDVAHQGPAYLSLADRASRAEEQRRAKRLLQAADGVAHRAAREAEIASGGAEGAGARRRFKRPERRKGEWTGHGRMKNHTHRSTQTFPVATWDDLRQSAGSKPYMAISRAGTGEILRPCPVLIPA